MTPKVATVILNYNGRQFLEQFLPTVISSTYENLEIIVADNASTDNSLEFLTTNFPEIRIIQLEQNYGYAGGYNNALKEVVADYFVLLNSDVEVTPGWIEPVIEEMERDKTVAAAQPTIKLQTNKALFEHAGAAGGFMDKFGYPFCRGRIFMVLEEDLGQYQYPAQIFWATGAAFFIRAELFNKFGGMDADYFAHMEEIDLCWSLKRAGYKIMSYPMSTVYHVGGGTLAATNPRKTYLNFRNSLVTLLKNENGGKLFWLMPLRLILDGLAGLRFLSEGKFNDIWAILRAHLYTYGRFFSILKKRKLVRKIIANNRIGEPNRMGIYHKSIVWQFFIKKKRFFKDL